MLETETRMFMPACHLHGHALFGGIHFLWYGRGPDRAGSHYEAEEVMVGVFRGMVRWVVDGCVSVWEPVEAELDFSRLRHSRRHAFGLPFHFTTSKLTHSLLPPHGHTVRKLQYTRTDECATLAALQ